MGTQTDATYSRLILAISIVKDILDTQGDIVRKMLKESIEGDSKAIQDIGS